MNTTRHARPRITRTALALWLLALALFPFAAAAACSGKLADLQAYASRTPPQRNLFGEPGIAARLARLPYETRLHLQRNLGMQSGPPQLVACHLRLAGNLHRQGGEEDAMLDVDLASGTMIVAIHSERHIDIYVIADPASGTTQAEWNQLPRGLRDWAVRASSGFSIQHPRRLARPVNVRLTVAPPEPQPEAVASKTMAKVRMDGAKPTPVQDAAIRRATGSDLADCKPSAQPCYSLGTADFNADGRPDLVVVYAYATGFCGSAGCNTVLVMATPHGYADKAIGLAYNDGDIDLLNGVHHGMHDLRYGDSPPWYWNGREYVIERNPSAASSSASGSSDTSAARWRTRQTAGYPLMALATPIDSTIRNLLVFCEQSHPLLAMITRTPRPAGPATLTFVFNGWTVNAPMQQSPQDARLWISELSRSDLPLWLAHRGNSPTTQSLAQATRIAYLRINGRMAGQVSLKGSTAATQAALGRCYRY